MEEIMSSKDVSPRKNRLSPRKKVEDEDLFALAAQLFYRPDASIDQLRRHFELSPVTVKRMLRRFREKKIALGRLGSRLNLSLLPELSPSFCKAIVAAETDTERLKSLSPRKGPEPHDVERALLNQLCKKLPREERYNGRIIIEEGHIVMGEPQFSLVMLVHGVSTSALFDFCRLGIERVEGVHRTRTLMITYTVI
jgi:DNA-binding Lrp family transcriptional regulator